MVVLSLVGPDRICPGKHFALRMVYLAIACVLSVFDISPVLDDDGTPRLPKIEFDNATVRYVFLEPSTHTAADFDRPATSHQVSQTFRMYYRASF